MKKVMSYLVIISLVMSTMGIFNPSKLAYAASPVPVDLSNGDWTKANVTMENTPEAQLMVRVGDIDNMGYTWGGIDPFSGKETTTHGYPYKPGASDPDGTDRVMIASGYNGGGTNDGYTSSTWGNVNYNTKVSPINFSYNLSGRTVVNAVIQLFIDDIQPSKWVKTGTKWINNGLGGFSTSSYNKYEVSFTLKDKNPVRIPEFEEIINNLDQHGPIGKLVTFTVPDKYLSLFQDGEAGIGIKIDDTRTTVQNINGNTINNTGDGYAIDFAKLKININDGHTVYSGTIKGNASEGYYDTSNKLQIKSNSNLSGVKLTISGIKDPIYTDSNGNYSCNTIPAGQVIIIAEKDGYEKATFTIDKLEASKEITYNMGLIKTDVPLNPSISLSTYSPTNQNLTVTIDYQGTVTKKYYRIDGGLWQEYSAPFIVEKNCTIEAKASKDIKISATAIKTLESAIIPLQVTNIDKTIPSKPIITPSTTAITNKNVTVTIEYSAISIVNEYSLDHGTTWLAYKGAITITDSPTEVKARSSNALGTQSPVASLNVNNIDKSVPTAPVITADIPNTVPTNQNVTVTVTFPAVAVVKEISRDKGTTWQPYVEPILITEPNVTTTIEARCTNAAGTTSEIASLEVSNIDRITPTGTISYIRNTDGTLTATLVNSNNPSKHIAVTNNSGSFIYIFIKSGSFTFEFVDDAGNKGEAIATGTVFKDENGRTER